MRSYQSTAASTLDMNKWYTTMPNGGRGSGPIACTIASARASGPAARELGSEAARAYLEAPVSDNEREQAIALIRWFTRRYPTPLERLAYVRRAYARWRLNAL